MEEGDEEAIARALEEDFVFEQNEETCQKLDDDFDISFISVLEAIDNEPFAWEEGDGKKVEKTGSKKDLPMSVVDQQWEIIDPNPNIHELFIQFDKEFFWGTLTAVAVSWSNRMTLCAGVCSYESRGGLCAIRLSQPLLKFRPRRDLVETLLHEMIHAYLFVTDNNKDHDGHGPNFLSHMHRINSKTGSKITVYHSFNDEVDYQRKHWWKCNGPCQKRRPYFGVVKRAMNRAPSARDPWWSSHQSSCGGTFIKIKEPEKPAKKSSAKSSIPANASAKDIRTFFPSTPPAASSSASNGNAIPTSSFIQSEKSGIDKTPKERRVTVFKPRGFVPFSGKGHTLGSDDTPPSDTQSVGSPMNDRPFSSVKKPRPSMPVLKPTKHPNRLKAHGRKSSGSNGTALRGHGGSRTIVLGGKVKTKEKSQDEDSSSDEDDRESLRRKGKLYLYSPFNQPGHVLGDSSTSTNDDIPPKADQNKTKPTSQRSLEEHVDSKPAKRSKTIVIFSSDSEDGDDKKSSTNDIKPFVNTPTRTPSIEEIDPLDDIATIAPQPSPKTVPCPVCSEPILENAINSHLDVCLMKS